jgi:transposase
LLKEWTGPVIVVWDGGSRPKGDPIRDLEGVLADRLMLEKLPP